MKLYSVNENYFSVIDSEEKAYWLGFIAADGNIGGIYDFRIELQKQDLSHLEKLKVALNSTHPIKLTSKNTYLFRIVNKQFYSDLIKQGIYPCKSLTS